MGKNYIGFGSNSRYVFRLPVWHTSKTANIRYDRKYFFEILQKICCLGLDIWVTKLVEAENAAIPVEAENRKWYNPLKGYG